MSDIREQLQTTLSGAYTLERELGGGGMSRTFVAEETALGRKVVVKVLPAELAGGVNVDRFKREISLAARLQQAHIVPVITAGEIGEGAGALPYYTMPFVEGESLRARLARGPLPIGEATSVLKDVARALAYAHERGIVHRDIKPDNVLLSGGSAVVTDFGIAKALTAARADGQTRGATLTSIGTSLGTPAYIAPEQAAGDPDVDHRADLYSFGCMAFELLAGRPPFVAKTPQRLLAAHMSETPPDVRELRPDAPPALAELVARCLSKEPAERPQSAAELLPVLDGTSAATGSDALPAMPAILLGGRGMLTKALALYAGSFLAVAVLAKAAIVGIGLPDWVFPGALIVMALGLPVILFTAYIHHVTRRVATATAPTLTPGGSLAPRGTMATIALRASPHVSWRRAAMGGVYALAGFVFLVGGWMLLRALGIGPAGSLMAKGALGDHERILVADFTARTADTTLGSVVTEAFRTSLGESPNLAVMQPTAVRDVLRRMQHPVTARVDFPLAREIATREGLKAVVDGEVLGVGGSYVLSAKLMSVQSGEPLASFSERADDAKGILPALDRLSRQMRARIGESLRSVQAAPLLEQVTTPSLEALRKYVQGAHALEADGDFTKGVGLLEEAIGLDTGFAMAYRKLAMEIGNAGGQTAREMELLQKAYAHRDRLSDAERYLTEGSYWNRGPQQDAAKAISAYEALIDLQPQNSGALNNVANLYRQMRDFAKAKTYYERALAAGPPAAVFFNNLMVTDFSLGDTAGTRDVLKRYLATLPTHPNATTFHGALLIATHQYDSAATLLETYFQAHAASPTRGTMAAALSRVLEIRGRVADAEHWRGEQRRAGRDRGVRQAALGAALDTAYFDLWYRNDRERGLRQIDAALAAHPLATLEPVDRPYDYLVWLYTLAGRADRARAEAAAFERDRQGTKQIGDDEIRHLMAGDVAVAEKRWPDAEREYRAADAGACTVCALPNLGRAYDLAGNADSAIAVFRRYVETPFLGRAATDATFLAGSYKRLGELYEAKGDRADAAAFYQRFVELWKNADPELQPQVAEVKKRLGKLADTEKR